MSEISKENKIGKEKYFHFEISCSNLSLGNIVLL